MSNPEKFNDILKSKFNNWEHPVDENNWKEMRGIINASRGRKRRLAWAAILLMGLMMGAGVLMFTNTGNKPQLVKQPVKTNEMNNTVQNTASNGSNMVAATTVPQNYSNAPNQPDNNKFKGHNNTMVNSGSNKVIQFANALASVNPAIAQETNTGSPEIATVVGKKNPHQFVISDPAMTPDSEVIVSKNTTQESNPVKTLPAITPNEAKPADKTADNIGKAKGLKSDISPGASPYKRNFFSVELGLSYSFGWAYHDTIEGRSLNPIIGMGYMHKFNNRWSVKSGLQFSYNTGMSSTPRTVSHVDYDNSTYNDTTTFTHKLFYLTIPVQFEYTFKRVNAFGAGGTISWLFAGYGNQISYTETFAQVTVINSNKNQFISLDGYTRLNTSAYIFYKRQLGKQLAFYFTPYFGFTDIKNNAYFMRDSFERDWGLKFTFSYNIF